MLGSHILIRSSIKLCTSILASATEKSVGAEPRKGKNVPYPQFVNGGSTRSKVNADIAGSVIPTFSTQRVQPEVYMNRLPNASLDRPSSGSGGHHGSVVRFPAQQSPTSIKQKHRKRPSDAAGFETTDSEEGAAGLHDDKRPRIATGVKRACNECRQQKVSATSLAKHF